MPCCDEAADDTHVFFRRHGIQIDAALEAIAGDEQHQALGGISRWASEAAFLAVMQVPSGAAVPAGERQPRQRFYFTSASPGTSPDHTD